MGFEKLAIVMACLRCKSLARNRYSWYKHHIKCFISNRYKAGCIKENALLYEKLDEAHTKWGIAMHQKGYCF
jgi:hypothetical protein